MKLKFFKVYKAPGYPVTSQTQKRINNEKWIYHGLDCNIGSIDFGDSLFSSNSLDYTNHNAWLNERIN